MRPCQNIFLVTVLCIGLSLQAGAQIMQQPQLPQLDDHLIELTPTSFTPDRRLPLEAQQHYLAARAAAFTHQPDLYSRECAQALAIAPQFAEVALLRATQELSAAHYERAIWNIAKARLWEPHIAFASTLLASSLNGMHRYDDAFLVLRDLHGDEAETWQTIYERARAEVGMGNLHGSDLWSQRALAAAPPTFAEVHLIRGEALAVAARWEEARSELRLYLQSTADQNRRLNALAALATLDTIARLPQQ
jgi:hypothetical protein